MMFDVVDDGDDCVNATCWPNSYCVDGVYSFTCQCDDGFEEGPDGDTCTGRPAMILLD